MRYALDMKLPLALPLAALLASCAATGGASDTHEVVHVVQASGGA